MIWFTSDTHFGHDKEFIWKVRGFESCEEMNETLVANWNERVKADDDVFHLGDIMLGSPDNLQYLGRLNGRIHIIYGNHDTNNRIALYNTVPSVIRGEWAERQKWYGYHFYLSHFPTITSNLEKESLKQCTINLYGHTHQKTNFYLEYPFMYHVGVDSHNCAPVSIDEIIDDICQKERECKKYLDIPNEDFPF